MRHETGARAEDGEIAAALLHLLQLIVDDGFAKLVVADLELTHLGSGGGIFDPGNLPVAPVLERFWRRGVMAVHVDNQLAIPPGWRQARSAVASPLCLVSFEFSF